MPMICLALTGWLTLAQTAAPGTPPREPLTILLADDGDVLYRSGTKRVLTTFSRHSDSPVLAPREPWEQAIGWVSIYHDRARGLYQLWYQAYAGNVARDRTRRCTVCYAESKDGIRFTRPDLDLFNFNDSKLTNIVLVANGGTSDRYGCSVVVEPQEPDPARRYKMAWFDFAVRDGREHPGTCVGFSPDGIHWAKQPVAPVLPASYGHHGEPLPNAGQTAERPWAVPLAMSDAVDVFYDPPNRCYAMYGKMWIDGPDGGMYFKHAMGRTQSRDFVNWTRPELVLSPDDHDPPWVEFHSSPVFYHARRYWCLNQILDRATDNGVIDIELAVSLDGLNWQRPFRGTPVLARGRAGSFDAGSIFTNSTPVVLEDEIRFYYGAYGQGATGGDDTNLTSGIGLATIPRDRFAGLQTVAVSSQPTLRAPLAHTAQVTLRARKLTGYRKLTLNADAREGAVRVELLNREGYPVPGFSASDSRPVTGDGLGLPMSWSGGDLPALPPGEYMIRIHLQRATIYGLSLLP